MNEQQLRDADAKLVFRVAQLFIEQRRETADPAKKGSRKFAENIAEQIRQEFKGVRFTRQMAWAFAGEAMRRGFFILAPPYETTLQTSLVVKYPHLANRLHVVHTSSPTDNRKVAIAAAHIALEAAKKIAKSLGHAPLGLGLGPGRATRDFCEVFSQLIEQDRYVPKLDLVAISAGCPAKEPEYASTSFFNLFKDHIVNSRTGLFAQTLVYPRDLRHIRKRAGVKEAMEAQKKIHMVVTSMGDMNDKDDLLRLFLEDSQVDVEALIKRGWVGNVQYRPYTIKGPVKERANDLRAVTLFELDDLRKMATDSDDKCVILIARRCAKCGRTRADALKPLLEKDSDLRVFSHLVMDSATCGELVGDKNTTVAGTL